MSVNLPVAGHAVAAALDHWGATVSGLQTVDGLGVDRNITGRRGNLFEIGQRSTSFAPYVEGTFGRPAMAAWWPIGTAIPRGSRLATRHRVKRPS